MIDAATPAAAEGAGWLPTALALLTGASVAKLVDVVAGRNKARADTTEVIGRAYGALLESSAGQVARLTAELEHERASRMELEAELEAERAGRDDGPRALPPPQE